MLGHLEEPCIIVMDNAIYNSTLIEEYHKANTRKVDIQKWLQKNSVDLSSTETLCEIQEKNQIDVAKRKNI